MSDTVVAFPPVMTVTRAWERYAALQRAAMADPRLTVDRAHQEAVTLAHHDWRKLFLEMERPKP